jgi:hypothetical protein
MASDTVATTRQCVDCGGVTTKGGGVGSRWGNAWMCAWCEDGWTGWPRVGNWRPPEHDDRTYPDGEWPKAFGGGPAFEAKRAALVARGCTPA